MALRPVQALQAVQLQSMDLALWWRSMDLALLRPSMDLARWRPSMGLVQLLSMGLALSVSPV